MAKSTDKPEKDEGKTPARDAQEPQAQAPAPQAQRQPPRRVQVQVDDSNVVPMYANFCRVTGTPEELILDFGLNPQPIGIPSDPIPVTHRIITNFYTAKRMLHALQLTLQRHEATFGVLEIDVQRRVRPGVMGQQAPPAQQPPPPSQ